MRPIGPVEQVSSVASLPVTVLRNDRVDRNATGGITVKAARPNLLPVLRGSVAQGRFLNAATERYPVVVLGSVAAERLGIATLRPQTAIDVGGSRFTVVGILDTLPLAPDIDRSALIGYPQAQAAFPPSSYPSDGGVSPSVVYARTDPESVQPVHDVLAATANPRAPRGGAGQPAVRRAHGQGGGQERVQLAVPGSGRGGVARRRGGGRQRDGDVGAGAALQDRLDQEVDRVIAPFARARDRLDTITGVGKRAAECIIAETGPTCRCSPPPPTSPRGCARRCASNTRGSTLAASSEATKRV